MARSVIPSNDNVYPPLFGIITLLAHVIYTFIFTRSIIYCDNETSDFDESDLYGIIHKFICIYIYTHPLCGREIGPSHAYSVVRFERNGAALKEMVLFSFHKENPSTNSGVVKTSL